MVGHDYLLFLCVDGYSVISVVAHWRDYLELCKPRVVMLMVLTSIVGMCLAAKNGIPWHAMFWGNIGIALAAAAAATVNHVVDSRFDRLMRRTERRPIARGRLTARSALLFSATLAVISMGILIIYVNALTAILTFMTLIGYAVIYTAVLKHVTVQNIVIGGAAGAAPPVLGWVAVTGHIDAGALLLMMIIFLWTPPHFWALSIHRIDDYAKANIPMLPNRFGIPYTKINILLYTILLSAATILPFLIGLSGWLYLVAAGVLDMGFLCYAVALIISDNKALPMQAFWYSIVYLMLLFVALLVDHYV